MAGSGSGAPARVVPDAVAVVPSRVGRRLNEGDLGLPALTVPKASDILADHLRQQILSGQLEEGVFLPVERDLAATSGLSRGTVREALRILEIEGLVDIRPGRSGGTAVRRPGLQPFERSIQGFVLGRRIRLPSVVEVREAVEPFAAGLAAERRTEEELAAIEEATVAVESNVDDLDRFLDENVIWHVSVAKASHNELIFALMSSLSTLIRQGTDIPDFNREETKRLTVKAHRRVLRAVTEGKRDEAFTAMSRHVHGFHVAVAGRLPEEGVVVDGAEGVLPADGTD
ncbi:MAG: FCD domain-containing protein [Actinomycetota bacterium]|nr:FCD domain-containing protein [Actinomycetota bacterium]